MRTDDLIGALAQAANPPPLNLARLGAEVAAVTALAGALFLALAGTRADLAAHLVQPLIALKTAFPLTLALIALPLMLRSLRPEARLGAGAALFALPLLAAAALWLWTFTHTAPPARFVDVGVLSLAECMGLILAISALPAWATLRLIMRGASLHPARTGALAGLAVSAEAASFYSLFCTQDNPLFYLTWYGTAMALVTLAGAVLGRRWLRW